MTLRRDGAVVTLAALVMLVSSGAAGQVPGPAAEHQPEYTTNEHGVRLHRILTAPVPIPGEDAVSAAQAKAVAERRLIASHQARRLLAYERRANDLALRLRAAAPDTIAGFTLNDRILGTATIAVAATPGPLVSSAMAAFPWPETLRLSAARNTAHKLHETVWDISELRERWQPFGYRYAHVDERLNRVIVGIEGDLRTAWHKFEETFGQHLVIARRSSGKMADQHVPPPNAVCAGDSRAHCNPLRGGTEAHAAGQHEDRCTWGYVAEDTLIDQAVPLGAPRGARVIMGGTKPSPLPTVPPLPTSSPTIPAGLPGLVILTAEHCSGVRVHSDAVIGPRTLGVDTGTVDAVRFEINESVWEARNWIYETATVQAHEITSVYTGTNLAQGTDVCVSGFVGGLLCGEVRSGNFAAAGYTNLLEYDMCTLGGDSGAPVFSGGEAIAIHKGLVFPAPVGECRAVGSYAANVEEQLHVRILTAWPPL